MKPVSNLFRSLIFLLLFIAWPGFFQTASAQFITVQNGNFYNGPQPWFPYGFNYVPWYAFQFPQTFAEFWLGDGYRPAIIEAELATLASLGVNCLTVLWASKLVEKAPKHLPDFLTTCRNHNIKVIMFFSIANPMDSLAQDGPTYGQPPTPYIDPEAALDHIIPDLRLDQRPEILSYDIAWEPRLGTWSAPSDSDKPGRCAWDGVWSRFIAREFNSIDAANQQFGKDIVRTSSSKPASGLVSLTMPVRARVDSPVNCTITMKNLGVDDWKQDKVFLLPIFGDGLPSSASPIRLNEASVAVGNRGTFSFTYNAASPGRKRLRLIMVSNTSSVNEPFGTLVEWEVEAISAGRPVVRTITAPTPILGCQDDELDPKFQAKDPRIIPVEPPLPDKPPTAVQDLLVNAYRRCLDTETATRFGRVCRRIRQLDPNHLISCRQGLAGNGNPGVVPRYPLELVSTAYHFDFQGVEAYYLDANPDPPLSKSDYTDYLLAGMATNQAYSRWATNGKPVIWSEVMYCYAIDNDGTLITLDPPQEEYFSMFITSLLQTYGNGVQFWWWPGGLVGSALSGKDEDWGVINPDGSFRPSANVVSSMAVQATSPRTIPPETVTGTVDLLADARGYAWTYCAHQQEALAAVKAGKAYALQGKGTGKDSSSADLLGGLPQYLWAEITKVELRIGENGEWFEVRDGMAYAVPRRQKIYCRAEVINMGDATWLTNVAFAARPKQANFLTFTSQSLAADTPRLTKVTIPGFKMTDGLTGDHPVQFQMNAQGVCWITGSVQIQLVVDKPTLTWLNLLLKVPHGPAAHPQIMKSIRDMLICLCQ